MEHRRYDLKEHFAPILYPRPRRPGMLRHIGHFFYSICAIKMLQPFLRHACCGIDRAFVLRECIFYIHRRYVSLFPVLDSEHF